MKFLILSLSLLALPLFAEPDTITAGECKFTTAKSSFGDELNIAVAKGEDVIGFSIPAHLVPLKDGIYYSIATSSREDATIRYKKGVLTLYHKNNTDFLDSQTLTVWVNSDLTQPTFAKWSHKIGPFPLSLWSTRCKF